MTELLGLVGIISKGVYANDVVYSEGQFVYYNGSTYLYIGKDDTSGIAPNTDTIRWQIMAKGTGGEKGFTWGDLYGDET